ncbi:hypothetical protein KP509_39G009700 [Ceratopteris richardii]|uniref:Uncharacterized protein n=1 Tax=Ceratopteris richardii TaxID=49495 RepID=A0A8T2PY69_CERRI|nr:hypothetical protein KP509_39G009700 [Ceratopteris richardii]
MIIARHLSSIDAPTSSAEMGGQLQRAISRDASIAEYLLAAAAVAVAIVLSCSFWLLVSWKLRSRHPPPSVSPPPAATPAGAPSATLPPIGDVDEHESGERSHWHLLIPSESTASFLLPGYATLVSLPGDAHPRMVGLPAEAVVDAHSSSSQSADRHALNRVMDRS